MGDRSSISLLGPVECTVDDRPVSLGGPIPRLLFVQLVLARGRTVPDESAIDAVWAQRPPDSVSAALRVHVAALRAAVRMAGWSVDREHYGYCLHTDEVQLDVDQLSDAERDSAIENEPVDALAAAEHGLSLWRGPSLVDVRRLPLGQRLGNELDHRRAALTDRRLELLVEMGRSGEVLAPLEALVREDPLNEARWALLANARYRTGHPAEALHTLADARRALDEEAGLLPGPALRELHQRILTHSLEPARAHPAGARRQSKAVPATLRAQLPPRLYGRDRELATLTSHLNDVLTGRRSTVVWIHGEAGSGKSALAAQLATAAAAQGVDVLYGWAEKEGAYPLGLLAGPLRDLRAETPDPTGRQARETLDAALGRAGRRSADPAPHLVAPATGDRARVFEAVRRTLSAGQRPVVVVLDDIQWADELSIAVIRSIARFPVSRPLLIAITERDSQTSPFAGLGTEDLPLRPLGAQALATWARRDDPEWVGELLALTGGLPLLVEEVLGRTRDGIELAALRATISQRLLRDRTVGLTERARRVLLVAAILGPSFGFDDLLAITGAGELALVEDLDACAGAGILRYDVSDPAVFRFAHDLLRPAMLEGVVPLRQMRLHAAVLDGLTDLTPGRALHHARAAGRFVAPPRVAELTIHAVTEQLRGYGFEDARVMALRTLADHGAQLSPGLRARLMAPLARAETALGQAREGRAHFQEALAGAQISGDVETATHVVLLLEEMFGHGQAMAPDTPAQLERLYAALPGNALELRFAVLRQWVFACLSGGRLDEAAALLARARLLAAELGTPEAESHLLSLEYFRCECGGDVPPRLPLVRRAGELAMQCSDGLLTARYLGMAIIQHLHDGEIDHADHAADRLTELGTTTGDPYSRWLGCAAKFSAPLLAGDLETARRMAIRAYEYGSASELFAAESSHLGQMFVLGWVTGNLQPFHRPAEAAPELEGPELTLRAVAALIMALAGNSQQATAALTSLADMIPVAGSQWVGFVGLALAVEAAALVGHEEVLLLAEPILRRRRADHVILGTGILDLGPVARYLALTCAGTGRPAEASALLAAVRDDPRSGAIWAQRAAIDLGASGHGGAESVPAEPGAAWGWLSASA